MGELTVCLTKGNITRDQAVVIINYIKTKITDPSVIISCSFNEIIN